MCRGQSEVLVLFGNLAYSIAVPGWLESFLPRSVVELATTDVLFWVACISGLALLASLIGVPLFLARLPADYFSRREERDSVHGSRSPGRLALKVLKNVLGVALLVLGFMMLLLPGQGILTVVVGLLLVDFPGKRRLELWLLGRPSVFRAINALRRRMKREPFERPASGARS